MAEQKRTGHDMSAMNHEPRIGDVSAMVRLMKPLHEQGGDPSMSKRRFVADYLRFIGRRLGAVDAAMDIPRDEGLSPRLRQTLRHLLSGDSEKQIAGKMKLSPHTVHVYVKNIYRYFGVCSRGELLARWVRK